MRPFIRAASIAAATAAAALAFPSLASADITGEIGVAASASGNDLTVTFTDETSDDADRKFCFVLLVDEDEPERLHRLIRVHDEHWSGGQLEASNLTNIPFPEGGEFSHTYTDLPDGQWQVFYSCGAGNSVTEEAEYWSNADDSDLENSLFFFPSIGEPANREPIVITLPQEAQEPDCTGLACLLLSGSAG